MPASKWYLRTIVVALLGVVALRFPSATAVAETPPGTPSSVSIAPGDRSAVVSWAAPDDGGEMISSYTITADPGGATTTVPGVARSATLSGLTNGVPYRFTVTASNRLGAGPPSAVSNAVTPTLVSVATSGVVVVDDDFATTADDFTVIAGSWAVASGRYTLAAPADEGEEVANSNLSVQNTVVPGDFTLTAMAATTPTDSLFNDFSIVFGFQDPANYYFASFSEGNDGNTSGIFNVVAGARTQLADITVPVAAGTVYPIRIEREGTAIRVFRSGERVASVSDTTFTSGRVGFGSRNDGGTFDDLTITAPTPPPPPPKPAPGFFARVWAWIRSLFTD
jgi:Fibronectin type III domain